MTTEWVYIKGITKLKHREAIPLPGSNWFKMWDKVHTANNAVHRND